MEWCQAPRRRSRIGSPSSSPKPWMAERVSYSTTRMLSGTRSFMGFTPIRSQEASRPWTTALSSASPRPSTSTAAGRAASEAYVVTALRIPDGDELIDLVSRGRYLDVWSEDTRVPQAMPVSC
jgi:hypothetical protein